MRVYMTATLWTGRSDFFFVNSFLVLFSYRVSFLIAHAWSMLLADGDIAHVWSMLLADGEIAHAWSMLLSDPPILADAEGDFMKTGAKVRVFVESIVRVFRTFTSDGLKCPVFALRTGRIDTLPPRRRP